MQYVKAFRYRPVLQLIRNTMRFYQASMPPRFPQNAIAGLMRSAIPAPALRAEHYFCPVAFG